MREENREKKIFLWLLLLLLMPLNDMILLLIIFLKIVSKITKEQNEKPTHIYISETYFGDIFCYAMNGNYKR